MSGWRSSAKRPRNGQKVVVVHYGDFSITSGKFYTTDVYECCQGWRHPWSSVQAWVPERELKKAARAAAKGGES